MASAGAFVKHVSRSGGSSAPSAPETFRADGAASAAEKMADGFDVPDRYVWGAASLRLLNSGSVSAEVMQGYREASVSAFREVYRNKAQSMMERHYGAIVSPYFAMAAE